MSNDIDWSKAPEGATHYGPETQFLSASWYKQVNGAWIRWVADGPAGWRLTAGLPSNAIARPIEWGGNGLPPVGTECEHQGSAEDDHSWFPVLILAHAKVDDRYVAVFQRMDDEMLISFSEAVFFRPIRTLEQRADEKREREIAEIEQVILHAHYGLDDMDAPPSERARAYARAIHYFFKHKTEQEQDQ